MTSHWGLHRTHIVAHDTGGAVAHARIEQSENLTVLVDSTKFNKLASFEVCPLSRIDQLVCDITPPNLLVEALEAAGVKTVLVT